MFRLRIDYINDADPSDNAAIELDYPKEVDLANSLPHWGVIIKTEGFLGVVRWLMMERAKRGDVRR